MDVFALREKVVSDYRHYIESFVRINDERIATFVEGQFESGALWPDAILQLNPAYEPGPTLDELAVQGGILKSTAEFFRGQGGKPLRLYRHQQQAIEIARRWESYIVTTGTGSGKSLTYLIPIVDHVLRTRLSGELVRSFSASGSGGKEPSAVRGDAEYARSPRVGFGSARHFARSRRPQTPLRAEGYGAAADAAFHESILREY